MKKTTLLAALMGLAVLSACARNADGIPDSARDFAKLESRDFDLAAFERIEISANTRLVVRQGERQSVRVSTEPDHFANLEIAVTAGTFVLDHIKSHGARRRHTSVEITVPRLSQLSISAIVEAEIEDIDVPEFELNFDGVGSLEISGACGEADYDLSGVGDLDLVEFRCQNVRARVSGIGNVEFFAGATMDLKASGIGNVTVHGNPRVLGLDKGGIGTVDFASGSRE